MKLYENRQPTYLDFLAWCPAFFKDLYELNEFLKVWGKIYDRIQVDIMRVFSNQFISTADESGITEFELFCKITPDKLKPISERRNILIAYFSGLGHMSATKIKTSVQTIAKCECEVTSEKDSRGNFILVLTIWNEDINERQYRDIYFWLLKFLPAHLAYRIDLKYNTHEKLSALTHAEMAEYTHIQLKTEEFNNA